jgi:hypothetical protein
MRLVLLCWPFLLVTAASPSIGPLRSTSQARGVAYFEPPKSVGTPITELARVYEGLGLTGRLRLDTDASLDLAARQLIRAHLAHRN